MRDKKIFVLKIVWRKSIASLHHLTPSVQRANLRRTAGDLTWVESYYCVKIWSFLQPFWFEVLKVLFIGSYYCVKIWSFLQHFWFEVLKVIVIGSYYCFKICFCSTFIWSTKIAWRKYIASLHCLTQAVQRANLRRMAGDPTWVWFY